MYISPISQIDILNTELTDLSSLQNILHVIDAATCNLISEIEHEYTLNVQNFLFTF